MVILTWKCLLSGLMLCDSHIMESPWASSPKTYKPMSSFVGPPLRFLLFVHGWNFSPASRDLAAKLVSATGVTPIVFLEKRWRFLAGNPSRHFTSAGLKCRVDGEAEPTHVGFQFCLAHEVGRFSGDRLNETHLWCFYQIYSGVKG